MLSPSAPIANAKAIARVCRNESVRTNTIDSAASTITATPTSLGRVLNSASCWP